MHFIRFDTAISYTRQLLVMNGEEVEHGRWQGLDLSDRGPEWHHYEILDLNLSIPMPHSKQEAQDDIRPNLMWAEDHFQERVGGEPLNPGGTYTYWPHWTPASEATLTEAGGKFTHTYMERFWPRYAGEGDSGPYQTFEGRDNWGIRYEYGDLEDVVSQLFKDPLTRQAYLPIFFPEDTGASHGGRVPCTLGYHFMMRGGKLHLWYDIRSCDFLRHFRDDLYLAVRLAQWVLARLQRGEYKVNHEGMSRHSDVWENVSLGNLYFTAHSMHVFMGDRRAL